MIVQLLQKMLLARRRHYHAPLFDSTMLADPYPTYAKLRAEDPVHWDAADNRWVLSRYADVAAVLRSPLVSSARPAALRGFVPAAARRLVSFRSKSMINLDGPAHARLRLLVSKAFTARAVEALGGDIQKLVEELLDIVEPAGKMDLIGNLACPLPVTVIAQMLGLAVEDRTHFKKWSDELSIGAGSAGGPSALRLADFHRSAAAFSELSSYFGRVIAERKVRPQHDLLSALAQAEEAGDRLSREELYVNAAQLLTAGNQTTTNLIGNGVLALLRNPDQLERLQRDPSLIPTAIEELLRYDSPAQFITRVLTGDMTVGGKQLRKGQVVLLLLGSANRDPEQFADPERLDVGRKDNKHLSFGLGTHFCLGAQLARLEGRLALETLLRRVPDLHLEGPEPQFREHFNLRGLKSLSVAFGPPVAGWKTVAGTGISGLGS